MKQRFSSLDVKVIAHELANSLVSLRVSNVYDLLGSSKIFLVKFAKPDIKQQIVIDSGFRCHLTKFARATAATPSPFVTRLRKVLKTRRVTSVSQVGTDRIIEFQFSDGQYKLYVEFYAGGNIILTDNELNILALLRGVSEGDGQEELRVGLQYSLENRQNYGGVPPLTKDRLHNALQKAVQKGGEEPVVGVKSKKKGADALRKALAVSITEFPPMLVDHGMRVTNFDSSLKPADVLQNQELLDHLMRSLEEAQRVVQDITSSEVARGYIIAKGKDETQYQTGAASEEESQNGLLYDDFHPFQPRQFEDDPSIVFLEFEGFNKTVDEFFSSIEGQKLESRVHERELTAKKKIEAARRDQATRLGGLQEVQELNERKAGAIEANVGRVQEAMDAVNGLIGQGMDWVEIGKLIELEQKRQNPVASIIKLPLKLHENTISLLLDEEGLAEDEDSVYETDSDISDIEEEDAKGKEPKPKATEKRLTIDINLALSPWSNAREYYDQKRSAAVKEQKTLQSSTKALKNTEAKIAQDLKKGLKQEKALLRPIRRQIWFEKFIWFISSDGYLVLGGKDSQQNEMLYKKYLKKGDVYLHADLPGAATVIIRNNPETPDPPIPPSTLSQAGTLVVACSSAWDSKAGMSAWWVNADQVSKAAPTGEFLPTGNFMISGKKNFLPPAQLLLGFGVMFQVSEESKARHTKHRLHEDVPSGGPVIEDIPSDELLGGEDEVNVENDLSQLDHEQASEGESADESVDETEARQTQTNPLQSLARVELRSDGTDEDPTLDSDELQLGVADKLSSSQKGLGSDAGSDDHLPLTDRAPLTGTQIPNAINVKKGPPPAKRGKKSKAKKIASKYKDQDEEDRAIAQQLIGATAGLEKAEAEAKAKESREAELAFQKERRRAQHQRTQMETAQHEQTRRQLMLVEGAGVESLDDEPGKMIALDAFVGIPLPGDEILEAIPVCAPWAAMGKIKYKAKLQPGPQKKGKAVKDILGTWLVAGATKKHVDDEAQDTERIWPREVELLRGWKVEEITNTVPVGKVKVMMAGGSVQAAVKGAHGKGSGGKGSKKQR